MPAVAGVIKDRNDHYIRDKWVDCSAYNQKAGGAGPMAKGKGGGGGGDYPPAPKRPRDEYDGGRRMSRRESGRDLSGRHGRRDRSRDRDRDGARVSLRPAPRAVSRSRSRSIDRSKRREKNALFGHGKSPRKAYKIYFNSETFSNYFSFSKSQNEIFKSIKSFNIV